MFFALCSDVITCTLARHFRSNTNQMLDATYGVTGINAPHTMIPTSERHEMTKQRSHVTQELKNDDVVGIDVFICLTSILTAHHGVCVLGRER